MPYAEDDLKEIEKQRTEWEEKVLKKQLARFGVDDLAKSPQKYYTPLDVKDFDFLEDVGFDTFYGGLDRLQLVQYVDTVTFFLDHPLYAAYLPFDLFESGDLLSVRGRCSHSFSSSVIVRFHSLIIPYPPKVC